MFFSSRRRHTRYWRDWSSDVCSSDLSAKRDARFGILKSNVLGGVRKWQGGRLGPSVFLLATFAVNGLGETVLAEGTPEDVAEQPSMEAQAYRGDLKVDRIGRKMVKGSGNALRSEERGVGKE